MDSQTKIYGQTDKDIWTDRHAYTQKYKNTEGRAAVQGDKDRTVKQTDKQTDGQLGGYNQIDNERDGQKGGLVSKHKMDRLTKAVLGTKTDKQMDKTVNRYGNSVVDRHANE